MMPNDYQTVPADAQMVPADAQMMPGEAQATSEVLEPDSDGVMVDDDVIADSADVPAGGFPEPGVPAAHWYPGTAAADTAAASAAEEPADFGEPEADIPAALASGADREPAHQSHVAIGSTATDSRWPEIQAMFVDDPLSSVELAAGLVVDSAHAVAVSIKQRQDALLAARQGNNAGTEELRLALQQYRALWNRLEDFSREPAQPLSAEAVPSRWNADIPA